jgi:hypothetical protein
MKAHWQSLAWFGWPPLGEDAEHWLVVEEYGSSFNTSDCANVQGWDSTGSPLKTVCPGAFFAHAVSS